MSTDPEEEYHDLYSYVGGNPIIFYDPDGESSASAIGNILKNFKQIGKPLHTMKQAQNAVKSGKDVKMASPKLQKQLAKSLSNNKKPMKHPDGHKGGLGHSHARGHPEGWGHIFSAVGSFLLNRTSLEFLAVRKGVLDIYGDFEISFENGAEIWTVGDGVKLNPENMTVGKGGVLLQKIDTVPGEI